MSESMSTALAAEKENPEVIAYLEAENEYAAAREWKMEQLQQTLYDEMLGRIKEDDSSVPWRKGDWLYHTRTEEGKPYPIQCRRRGQHGCTGAGVARRERTGR